jgi:hypothetical protein
MAPGNADLIRPIYEEWSRGSWRPRFDVYHPHMEWGWSDEFPLHEERYSAGCRRPGQISFSRRSDRNA